MRIIDVLGHLHMPVSNEEFSLLNKIGNGFKKTELSEREQVLAKGLVTKGILNRITEDQEVYFKRNTLGKNNDSRIS